MAKNRYENKPSLWKVLVGIVVFVMTKIALFMGIRHLARRYRAARTTA